MNRLTFPAPDDMHVHFRDNGQLATVVPFTARQFARAIVMPNLKPHVTTVAMAMAYRDRVLSAVPSGVNFTPLMTLSLTGATTTKDVEGVAKNSPKIIGFKLYAGHTTNADAVEDLSNLAPALQAMEANNVPLLLHGEASKSVDVFDREHHFYTDTMPRLLDQFPDLHIVCEHISSETAVNFVLEAPKNVGATITPQHLLCTRNHMLGAGIRPNYYCMPILKTERDRLALLNAATSGNPKFWCGTDSAPHQRTGAVGTAKYVDCGCAGCFTAPTALELYAAAFDRVGKVHMLPQFCSTFGAMFYDLGINTEMVTLEPCKGWQPEESYPFGVNRVEPFRLDEPLLWKATRNTD